MRWGRGLSNLCILCNAIQTNKHILSNCSSLSALARYTVRHDSLLSIIVDYLNTAIKDATLYSDLKGAKSVSHCFKSLRPDIVIVSASAKRVVSIELTVCHETNFESARLRKMNRYANLKSNLCDLYSCYNLIKFTIEISVLGFVSNTNDIMKTLNINKFPKSVLNNLTRVAIEHSRLIFNNRNQTDDQ